MRHWSKFLGCSCYFSAVATVWSLLIRFAECTLSDDLLCDDGKVCVPGNDASPGYTCATNDENSVWLT